MYTLQDERHFVKIIDEKFANSYINSNEFTHTISESKEVIIYNFLDSICYGFKEGELYIKTVVKYVSEKDKLKEKLENDNNFLLSIILINKYLIIENCTFFKSITYNNRLIEKSLKILDDKNKVEFIFKNNTLNNKFIFLLDKNYVINLILDLHKIKKITLGD